MSQGKVVVIGTAGHVDHGKSALVKALTGTDPDRLAIEQRRGMTIELGFAWCRLPSGQVASFVDVPGHEDFIHHMVAGAAAVQACLLVVAADEGPMPQTIEHLQILGLLGVDLGIVALTKVDLVEPDWRALVREEVRKLLDGSPLANAPLVEVSAHSGEGLTALIAKLEEVVRRAPLAKDQGRPRLAIDRVFTLTGFGTIVTGTLRDGALVAGQPLVVQPRGLRTRARTIHCYGLQVDTAHPGTRVAVNLAGLGSSDVHRGDWLASPEDYPTSQRVDARVQILAEASRPLRHDAQVQVFHGAAQIPARLRIMGTDAIVPGETGFAQLVLARPTALAAGDRFVIRQPSPSATLGGGVVLDPLPPRRWRRLRAETLERFAALASGSAERVLWQLVADRQPCRAAELGPAMTGYEPAQRDRVLDQLCRCGQLVRLGDLWLTDRRWLELRQRLESVLARFHAQHPLRRGPSVDEVRQQVGLDGDAFSALVTRGITEGWLGREGQTLFAPDHQVQFTAQEQEAARALLERVRSTPYAPPSARQLRAEFGAAVMAALIERGDLVEVSEDIVFDRGAYEGLRREVENALGEIGHITIAALRDRLGTSRRYAQAILEHLDRLHVTRRQGDLHVRDLASPAGRAAPSGSG